MDENGGMGILGQTLAIFDLSPGCGEQDGGEEDPPVACDQLQHVPSPSNPADESDEMGTDVVQHTGQAPNHSEPSPGCAEQEQGEGENHGVNEPQHAPSSSTERNEEMPGVSWDHILSSLWKCIVKPVLDALAFSVTQRPITDILVSNRPSHVSSSIHAAGFYNGQYSNPRHKIFDFVISSYVPRLAILMPSLGGSGIPSGSLRLLTVRQPKSDGQAPLLGVATKIAYVQDVLEKFPSAQTILVESSAGTVEEVLQLMKESDRVYFACHSAQEGVDSELCLADRRRLTPRDNVAVSRSPGGLAFLFVCQTATGERKLSDEAIHIAAGMLFAGYGGVIGTMWSISDAPAPRIARDIYTELLEKGIRPDYLDAVRPLQETIGRLRNQEMLFEEWIPVIHVGL